MTPEDIVKFDAAVDRLVQAIIILKKITGELTGVWQKESICVYEETEAEKKCLSC